MSINISTKPEVDVVNVGEEITQNQLEAITNSLNPSSSNVLITKSDLTGTARVFASPQQFDVTSSSSPAIRVHAASGQSVSNSVGALYVSVMNTATLGHAVVIENRGNGDCLRIHDTNAPDSTRFVVDASGNVKLGGTLTFADGTSMTTAASSAESGDIVQFQRSIEINEPSGSIALSWADFANLYGYNFDTLASIAYNNGSPYEIEIVVTVYSELFNDAITASVDFGTFEATSENVATSVVQPVARTANHPSTDMTDGSVSIGIVSKTFVFKGVVHSGGLFPPTIVLPQIYANSSTSTPIVVRISAKSVQLYYES